jgi:hypothetical protein
LTPCVPARDDRRHPVTRRHATRKRFVILLLATVAGGASASTTLAGTGADHNSAGVASSSLASPSFGPAVAGAAGAFPTAIPTLFDFADCGGNGFPP